MKNLLNVKAQTVKNVNTTTKGVKRMNKSYTVEYIAKNIFTDAVYSDRKSFDDLLKMWEFVIQLKKKDTTEKIWVTTTQEVYKKD